MIAAAAPEAEADECSATSLLLTILGGALVLGERSRSILLMLTPPLAPAAAATAAAAASWAATSGRRTAALSRMRWIAAAAVAAAPATAGTLLLSPPPPFPLPPPARPLAKSARIARTASRICSCRSNFEHDSGISHHMSMLSARIEKENRTKTLQLLLRAGLILPKIQRGRRSRKRHFSYPPPFFTPFRLILFFTCTRT